MDLTQIITAVLSKEYGWAVAEQFEAISESESCEEQNSNALDYIRTKLGDLRQSDCFNEEAIERIDEYYNLIDEYLNK